MNDSDIKYENKIVAFLDILGFRDLVFQSKDNAKTVIAEIDNALRHCLECLTLEGGPDWFSAKLFSDCICLSSNKDDLYYMLSELSFLQFYLSINGIFVRGALATGYHFENERMIFSEGLINAYELHKGDYYPRILIDAVLIKKISDDSQSNMMTPYVIMGPDGRYFLDYLQRLEEDGSGDIDDLFEAHKDAILKELNANIDNYKIVEKYRWLAEYHNHKFNEFYKSDDWVEDYFSELQEKLYIPMTYFPTFKKEIAAFTKL